VDGERDPDGGTKGDRGLASKFSHEEDAVRGGLQCQFFDPHPRRMGKEGGRGEWGGKSGQLLAQFLAKWGGEDKSAKSLRSATREHVTG